MAVQVVVRAVDRCCGPRMIIDHRTGLRPVAAHHAHVAIAVALLRVQVLHRSGLDRVRAVVLPSDLVGGGRGAGRGDLRVIGSRCGGHADGRGDGGGGIQG